MKWLTRVGAGIGVLVVTMAAYIGYLQLTGNFHEVIAGQFYRSGQLSAADIDRVTRLYHIRTIINLRGRSSSQWYRNEVAEAAKLGITHIDFKMSAHRNLSLDDVNTLTALMKNVPKPLLVHCEGGADRSGLAALIYTNRIAGENEDWAELQLSPLFGHFGIPFLTGSYKMDETWHAVEVADHVEG